jgi:hypothetical protein
MEVATIGFISSMLWTAKNPELGERMVRTGLIGCLNQDLAVFVLLADFA